MELTSVDEREWVAQAGEFLDRNYRQSFAFGVACAERLGAVSEHVAVREGARTLGLADVRIKRVPLLGAGVAYVNGGPLVRRRDGFDREGLARVLGALRREYVERRGLVLRVAPALGSAEWNETQTAACLAAGFAMAEGARRYRTLVVDLRPPLETVRKSLAGNWRGHLNRAERQGLRVCAGADVALFEEFCRLFDGLIDRKGFEVDLDARFHADVQRALDPSEQFLVTLAYQDGEAVSGHVASLLGDTCVYLLGATSRRGLERQAAYLLQWHVMATARERGCTSYDLGGIDPEANPGVYDFKKGLRGIELFSPGPFEAAPRGVRRWLALRGERLYRALRDRIGARG